MTGPAGIKAVAARAGVSVGTVSNVLNRPHLVRAETRAKVEAAMGDLGFVRNESARQLRAGQSRILAYVLMDAGNPFFMDVARGADDACRESGLALVLCNSANDPSREEDYLSLLLEQRVQGVLVTTLAEQGARLRSMPGLGVPVVLVDQRASLDPAEWCSVGVDDVHGGDVAVTHLLQLGHRRIAFAGNPKVLGQVADRIDGARRALRRAGRDPDDLIEQPCPLSFAGGREAGRTLLDRDAAHRPTAVVCANDLAALGLLQEVLHRGLRVPDDLAIIGYDDIDFAGTAAVPLTSVRQPREQLGRTAVELLLGEGRHRPVHEHQQVQFTPELVVRASTAG